MRIRTITGLALAGFAAATAVALGGAAYAEGQSDPGQFAPAVTTTTEDSSRAVTSGTDAAGSAAELDCPEKDGSAAEGGTGSAPAPAQPETATESL